jgi:hypothetical protein
MGSRSGLVASAQGQGRRTPFQPARHRPSCQARGATPVISQSSGGALVPRVKLLKINSLPCIDPLLVASADF